MKKRFIFFAALAVFLAIAVVPVSAAKPLKIIKGPYLQQLTPDSIVIMWETNTAADSWVDYGGTSPVGNSTPVKIHEIELTGLAADTPYYYTVTSDGVTSPTSTFATAPATERSFRFVAYGDTRTNKNDHAAVIQAIIASEPEFVLHTGDLVSDGDNKNVWGPEFFAPAYDLMIKTPLLPVIGNHEGSGNLFRDFFSLGDNDDWFAFSYSNVRFIGLNTHNRSYSPGSTQYNWLLGELTSDAYTNATWHIVYFHHPPYTATSSHSDEIGVQTHLVPLFEQNGVDMVFNGHSHAYERYFNNGIYYIVTGGGGAPLASLLTDTVEPIREFGKSVYHHCVIDVTAESLTLSARYNNGVEFDTVALGPDITTPTLNSVSATSQTTVEVVFSEPVKQSSAQTVANYAIEGVAISLAVLQADTRTVVLAVSTLSEGVPYTLTVNNVEDLASNPIAPNTQQTFEYVYNPPVAYWALDDGSGTTAVDSSGNDNDGTLKNGATFTEFGIYAGAVIFDGADDYIQVESTVTPTPPLGLPTFTLAAWFKRAGVGDTTNTGTGGFYGEPLVTKGRGEEDGDSRDMNYFLGLTQSGSDWVLAADFEEHITGSTPGLNHPVTGTTAISNNQWHHAAVTYNGYQWDLYLDGIPDGTSVVDEPPNFESIQYAAIGGALNSSGARGGAFNGTIDEVYIFEGALSPQEIINLMGNPPPTARLIVPLDNGPDDLAPEDGEVIVNTIQSSFKIQLSDVGDGIDDATVTDTTVAITKDEGEGEGEVPLTEGTDYSFSYNETLDVITLTPAGGDFGNGLYEITLSGIADIAGNPMELTTLTILIDTSIVPPVTLSFQQGINGYIGTVDTMLQENSPVTNNAGAASLNVDSDEPFDTQQDVQALVGFEEIFGNEPGQVPADAQNISALLELQVTNPGNSFHLHRMLQTWSDEDSWNTWFSGVQPDNMEAAATADASTGAVGTGTLSIDVTTSLETWLADPSANHGWVMLPTGADGVDFDSSEGTTPPKLIVTFLTTGNLPPTADAGPDQTVTDTDENGSESVTLDGSVSYDPDGEITTYEWKEGANVLGDTVSITMEFTVGTHTITLTVTDDEGATDSDDVVITVNPGGAIAMHVDSIVVSTVDLGKGQKKGHAEVVILDSFGIAVAGAEVTGTFYEDISETLIVTTNDDGVAVFDTTSSKKGRCHLTFCIDENGVVHATLTYDESANVETCDSNY